MNPAHYPLTSATRWLLVLAAFVVLVAGMQAAKPLLVPFLLSLFIAVIAAPPLFFLKNRGLPGWLAMLIVVLGIVLVGLLLGWMVGGSLRDFTDNLPKYQERLAAQSHGLLVLLQGHGVVLDEATLLAYLNPGKAMALAGKLLSGLGNVLTQAFFILITVIFILVEAAGFQAKLRAISADPDSSVARIEAITSSIKQYMMIKTSTSLLTGVLVTIGLTLLDVDYPVLWGVLAFLFNYVPNIGSIIAAVPAVLLAWVQLGPWVALWSGALYLIVNVVVGNLIEPRFMGRGLGLSPLIVFVSLVFWGWVLGPVGMFLSVPLTMTLKIILDSNHETRAISLILGQNQDCQQS
ncbi:MAG: AI-2E family transporter [Gammaproteobacteria bacterium]|nr:AI-2E family transporter [Gammaproteobacteria bacterium]